MELVRDRDRLVAALRARGIEYLAPSDATGEPISDELLIASLAASEDPRVRQALTALFLRRPELATSLGAALVRLWTKSQLGALGEQSIENVTLGYAEDELLARYMAAVYLQQLWRTTLGLYLGATPELPDLFSESYELPPASEGHGKPGLHALAEWHQARSRGGYNRLAEYQMAMNHLLASLQRQPLAYEPAASG